MEITILHNQSLFDIAIQHTADVTNAFLIAVANGICVTDYLSPGTGLIIPTNVVIDKDILNYYNAKGIQPATAYNYVTGEIPERLEGIGYWSITTEFIIN